MCIRDSDLPIIPDVGMLASFDPVALDLCCVDLCNAQPPMKGSIMEQREPVGHDHFTTLLSLIHISRLSFGAGRQGELQAGHGLLRLQQGPP